MTTEDMVVLVMLRVNVVVPPCGTLVYFQEYLESRGEVAVVIIVVVVIEYLNE